MDEEKRNEEQIEQNEQQQPEQQVKPAGKFIRIKPFAFIMVMFLTILCTAGLTIFALTFGEKKVVEVKVPVERSEFKKLYEVFDELKENYYVEIDDEKVVYGAINGMFEALGDPYSDYMNKEEASHFNEGLSSSFQGIGAEIQERNGYITVVSPIKNSPAEKAGILPKDIILSVDGESIKGLSASEAVLLIRGEKGSSVDLKIQRGESEELIDMTIVRDEIPIETVYGELDEDKIAHVQITTFGQDTYKELVKILDDLDKQGMKGIVLDVRQNPGGYLYAAEQIASLFIDEGKPILQVQGRDGEVGTVLAKGGKVYDLPMTVLIDEGSASASEILAAALNESAGVKVVGKKSFGKGTVQTVLDLPDGSNIKYTNSKWLTPNGNWINEKGITPTNEVDAPPYSSLPYIDPKQSFTIDSTSNLVDAAEQMLETLGYTAGKVDTVFDENTEAAVKQFQADQGLEETGILTGDTTYALMDALREKMLAEDPQLLKAKQLIKGE